jgi:hypothetical protein
MQPVLTQVDRPELPVPFVECSVVVLSHASAICSLGCANNGTCSRPDECVCKKGFHGALCDKPITSLTEAVGVGVCSYADASSACRVGTANQTDCPKHYQLKRVEKCSQVGLSRAVCKRVCCDGWQGSDCRTRNDFVLYYSHYPAACDPKCVNGECTASDVCTCNPTATGALCDVCTEGWTGAACSTRESSV